MRLFWTWCFIIALAGVVVSTSCNDDSTTAINTFFSAEEPFSVNVTKQARTLLVLEGINGTIEITGVAANAVIVSGVKRVESHTPDDAASHLLQLVVIVDSTDTEVRVQTEQPADSDGRNYIVDYTILVPLELSVDVTAANADVTVEPLDGDVVIACANGRLLGKAIEGNVTMALANGEIDVTAALPPAGLIDLTLANGDITLQIPQSTSAEFSATASSGNITIQDLTLTNVTQTPTSIAGTLGNVNPGDGRISLGVANGTIWVQGL